MKLRDGFEVYEEDTLPLALRRGDTLTHARGGTAKYRLLSGFRRVNVSGLFAGQKPADFRPVAPASAVPSQATNDKVRMLQAMLERLEKFETGSTQRPEKTT